MRTLAVMLIVFVVLSGAARAEEVVLADGTIVKGKIKGQKDGILEVLTADGNSVFINVVKVAAIRREESTETPSLPVVVEPDVLKAKITEMEKELERLRAQAKQSPSPNTDLQKQIDALKADIGSLKSDAAAGNDVYDRLADFSRRLDGMKEDSSAETRKLQDDLSSNSKELLKLVMEMTELKKKVSESPSTVAPSDPEGAKKLATLESEIAALRKDIGDTQGILSEIRELKIKNAELDQEIRKLREKMDNTGGTMRESLRAEIESLTAARMKELEAQNTLLSDRLREMKDGEVAALRAEVGLLKRRMDGMIGGAEGTQIQTPVFQPLKPQSGVPAVATGLFEPWALDVWSVTGADKADLGKAGTPLEPVCLNAEQADRWLKAAANAMHMGDSFFSDAVEWQRKGNMMKAVEAYKETINWHTLSLERFALADRSVHPADCAGKMIELEKSIALCKARVSYLKSISR